MLKIYKMNNSIIKNLVLGYAVFTIIGALLLMAPFSRNVDISFIDALFTATSASCVTGLIVQNTQYDFTFIGQIILAILIQVGGIGYMAFGLFFLMMLRKKLAYKERMFLKESLDYPSMSGIVRFLKMVFITVFLIEIIGAIILLIRFSFDMDTTTALWHGIFHSISAFNNAGFSIFEDNLMRYKTDLTVNLTICLLIILGGVGYFVLLEMYYLKKNRFAYLSMHTKIVLYTTLFLIVFGFLMVLSFEYSNPKTLSELDFFDKLLVTLFLSVNYRTAGFNTIDLSTLSDSTLYFSNMLMLIGGAPGGTAGGIKVTVFFIIVITVWFSLKNETPHIFKRTIPQDVINKSFTILIIGIFYITLSSFIIAENEKLPFINILFEVTSAFATVGLSVGNGGVLSLSALFSDVSKIVVILLMFVGRLGVLIFTLSVIGKNDEKRFKYPEGRVII
ncbi:MAG: potassium transporter [Campylobacterales bacterium]|nr:potassium transporter [Campylobacterales bacterium]